MQSVAEQPGVNMDRLGLYLVSDEVKTIVAADMAEAGKFGLSDTPGFLSNGVSLKGAYPLPAFKEIIDRHIEEGGDLN